MHSKLIKLTATFSVKKTKMPWSSIRKTYHMSGARKQKAEPAWEALGSGQQSQSLPTMLQVCVQSHQMTDPCWTMKHHLGMCGMSSQPSSSQHLCLGIRVLELLEFGSHTSMSSWGKKLFPHEPVIVQETAGCFLVLQPHSCPAVSSFTYAQKSWLSTSSSLSNHNLPLESISSYMIGYNWRLQERKKLGFFCFFCFFCCRVFSHGYKTSISQTTPTALCAQSLRSLEMAVTTCTMCSRAHPWDTVHMCAHVCGDVRNNQSLPLSAFKMDSMHSTCGPWLRGTLA